MIPHLCPHHYHSQKILSKHFPLSLGALLLGLGLSEGPHTKSFGYGLTGLDFLCAATRQWSARLSFRARHP